MRGVVRLRFTSGPFEGRVHEVREHDVLTIGRARDNAVRLPPDDHHASRHHLVVEVSPPEAVLRDLGSRHGTRINGAPIEHLTQAEGAQPGSVVLRDGDEVEAGKSRIRFELEPLPSCPRCGHSLDGSGRCAGCAATRGAAARPPRTCDQCGAAVDPTPGGDAAHALTCGRCAAEAASGSATEGPPPGGTGENDVPQLPQLGGYTVVHQIGAGGMGAVHLARRKVDGTWVALKVMLARVAVDANARQRFAREARIIDQLHHPNVVRFLDRGSVGQAFYFAMEFCPAGSAAQLVRNRGGRLALGEAVSIATQALEGLDHAHRCVVHDDGGQRGHVPGVGIVHRDVKPANLLLSGSERGWHVKVSDFGLAKAFSNAGLSGCTATGYTGGSLPFMAPEQLRDFKRVGPLGDLWSLGATLYALLAGSDPRQIRAQDNPLHAILKGTIVPLHDVAPAVPAGVAKVIESSLAVDPADRPTSAGWMIADLARAVYGSAEDAPAICLTPLTDGGKRNRLAILALAPRPATRLSPRHAREARRLLHESVVSVRGHTGVLCLQLHAGGIVVVLERASDALDLARRVALRIERKPVPLCRAIHCATVTGTPGGIAAGDGVDWSEAVARVEGAPPDGILLTLEALQALSAAALGTATERLDVAVGPDRRPTRLVRLPVVEVGG